MGWYENSGSGGASHELAVLYNLTPESVSWGAEGIISAGRLGAFFAEATRLATPGLAEAATFAQLFATQGLADALMGNDFAKKLLFSQFAGHLIQDGAAMSVIVNHSAGLAPMCQSEPFFAAICGSATLLNAVCKRNDAQYFTNSAFNPGSFSATPGKYFAMALATCAANPGLFTRRAVAAKTDQATSANVYCHHLDTNVWDTNRAGQNAIYFPKQGQWGGAGLQQASEWYATDKSGALSVLFSGKGTTITGVTPGSPPVNIYLNKIAVGGIAAKYCNFTPAWPATAGNAYGEAFTAN